MRDAEDKRKEALEQLSQVVAYLRHSTPAQSSSSAKRWLELLEAWIAPQSRNPSSATITLLDANGYTGSISEKGEVYGLCPHHMMPFFGTYTLKFYPKEKIIGLSSISRVVDIFSRNSLLQEELTEMIGQYFYRAIQPLSLEFCIEARHFCKEMRQGGRSTFTTLWKMPVK